MTKIIITAGDVVMDAELNDSPTAQAIKAILPIENSGNIWGDEIYFSIPVQKNAEPDAKAQVDVGALAYWPPGNAFCIFFGPTPASAGSEPQAASPVNVVGKVLGNATDFRKVPNGALVKIKVG
ncbi:MAG: cyclophilin-like fold protein [Chloroflexota bacterium]